uniref:Variant surface glycoprotein 1125.4837 n=1 Tax=Trypanosoma brucei TaxID=5691 RepID=A0A1J0RAU2_9TRYP|nr:variant surface glycoprotein 1125.4837 [Trypanosoma brucei]
MHAFQTHKISAFLLFLATEYLVILAIGAANGMLTAGNWQPLVTFAGKIKDVPGRATAILNKHHRRQTTLAELSMQISAYITAKNNNISTQEFGPVLMVINKLRQSLGSSGCTLNEKAIAAAAAIEFVRGGISEFFGIAANSYQAANNACLTTDSAPTADGNGANGVGAIPGAADALADSDASEKPAQIAEVTAAGFASLKANNGITEAQLSNAGSSSCKLFSAGANSVLTTTGVTKTVPYALGYLNKPADGTSIINADGTTLAAGARGNSRATMGKYAHACDKVVLIASDAAVGADERDIKDHGTITEMSELKTAINNLILKKKGEPAAGDATAINKHIKDHYTPRKDDFSKFWQKLKEVTIPPEITGTQATTLDQVRDLGQLAGALAFYAGKNANDLKIGIEELQAKKSKTQAKIETQICSEKEDAETCRQEKTASTTTRKKKDQNVY